MGQFLKEFEDRWEDIAAETHEVMKFRDTIPAFQEISPDQYRIATEKNWRTFILFGFGERLETNCAQMPVTTEILERVPNLRIAWLFPKTASNAASGLAMKSALGAKENSSSSMIPMSMRCGMRRMKSV